MGNEVGEAAKFDAQATLKLYVDLANSERQAIWARNAAMLVGNSFIINAIKSDMSNADAALNLFFCASGIVISALWMIMTWHGWTFFYLYMLEASKLPIPAAANPFFALGTLGKRRKDIIFLCTVVLIAIFICMYVVGSLHFLSQMRRDGAAGV